VVTFSADNKKLLLLGVEDEKEQRRSVLVLLDAARGRVLRRVRPRGSHVCAACLGRGGVRLLTAESGKTVCVWDTRTGEELRRFRVGAEVDDGGELLSAAFSPDGATLAVVGTEPSNDPSTGSRRFAVHLWDSARGEELRILRGPPGGAAGWLQFSPDGKQVFSVGLDRAVHRWDVATGRPLCDIGLGHQDAVLALAFSPDGKAVWSAGNDGTVFMWDARSGRLETRCAGHWQAMSPGVGVAIDVRPKLRTAVLREMASGRQVVSLGKVEGSSVDPLACLAADGRLGAVSVRGGFRVWDLRSARKLKDVHSAAEGGPIGCSPDGSLIATAGVRRVAVWDWASGRMLLQTGPQLPWGRHVGDYVASFCFSPDGRTLAVSHDGFAVQLWEVATGLLRGEFTGPQPRPGPVPGRTRWIDKRASCLAWAPDDRALVAGNRDGSIRLWDLTTAHEGAHLRGHLAGVTALHFSPDGQRLASGSDDTTVVVWDWGRVFHADGAPPARLNDARFDSLWHALAGSGPEAHRAYQAVRALASFGDGAVHRLGARLRPVRAPTPERINQLLKQLDAHRFAVREAASAELEELGDWAEPAMRRFLASSPSPEARRRGGAVLERRARGTLPPHQLQALRAIEVLQRIGTGDALRVLSTLTKGCPEARVTREARATLRRLDARALSARRR
jgi:WD40 repeat protein